MPKPKKKRADKYEKPLKIDGGFGDVIKVAVGNPDKPQIKPRKDDKKK